MNERVSKINRRNKINVPVPKWVMELPPGEYTRQELQEITGLTLQGITKMLFKYGEVEVKKFPCYKNLSRSVYIWKGYRE